MDLRISTGGRSSSIPLPGTRELPAAPEPRPVAAPTAPLDQLRLGSGMLRGLRDPLPSLARVREALGAAPPPAPPPPIQRARTGGFPVERLTDPALFVQEAYQTALGRRPTEVEAQRGLAQLSRGTSRQDLLGELVASPEFIQRTARVDTLLQAGLPVELTVPGQPPKSLLWPYPQGSRHGGPEKLANPGEVSRLGEALAPFAHYFGAGTRGSLMTGVQDMASHDQLHPGSQATRELGDIARNLFWDLPMQQNSDDVLRGQGVPPSLSKPEAMIAYLDGQRARVSDLVARQDPVLDGPLHRQAGQELLAMLEGATARAQAFVGGDRRPIQSRITGDFGIYNAAEPAGGAPRDTSLGVLSDPAGSAQRAEAELLAHPEQLGPDSFYQKLRTHLLGS